MQQPYDENQNRSRNRYRSASLEADVEELVNGAVQVGSRIGSSVLGSIAAALRQATGEDRQDNDFLSHRRLLDRKLGESFGGNLALAIVGGIFAGSFGIAALVMGLLNGVNPATLGITADEAFVFDILCKTFTPITLGFGVMFGCGLRGCFYYSRLRRYLRTMRDWVMPLREIARASAVSLKTVTRDLKKATLNGQLPNASLDPAGETLYLDETLWHPAPPPAAAPASEPAPAPSPEEQFRRSGVDFLNYLTRCQGKLPADADAELSAMRRTCAAVIGFIHTHPEQLPRVRRFAEYYLPTTRRLLDTAMGLGDAEVDSAETIRRDITGILHTLNTAYGRLYDTLLQDVSMDVSAEIDTLEAMLSQDGLTRDFASDFGKQEGNKL
ncbi:MAG: hypothetical protein ACI4OI_03195 [Gemmiger sp.]